MTQNGGYSEAKIRPSKFNLQLAQYPNQHPRDSNRLYPNRSRLALLELRACRLLGPLARELNGNVKKDWL